MRNHLLSLSILVLAAGFLLGGRSYGDPKGKSINRSFDHDGLERSYQLYLPSGIQQKEDYPLIVVLHGGGGSARSVIRLTQGRFNKIADEEDLIVVYPEAVRRYWNEGRSEPISYAHRNEVDDVGFISSMIESLVEEYDIDKNRVYLSGISNGGFMAFRMACERPELITAIATVNAPIPIDIEEQCKQSSGTSLMMIHGTDDPLVPYEGGTITAFGVARGRVFSAEGSIALWLAQNDCPGHAEKDMIEDRSPRDNTTISVYTYPGCEDGVNVLLYRVEGGGHTWPGGRQYQREDRIGRTSRDINASDEIWAFFQDQRR